MTDPTTTTSPQAEPTHKLGQLIKPDPTLRLAWSSLRRWEAPVWLKLLVPAFVVATWLPIAVAFEMRTNMAKREPRIHLVQDMDNQVKLRPQDESTLFADSRVHRPRVPGTVARDELVTDDTYAFGYTDTTGDDGKITRNFVGEWPAAVQAKLADPTQAKNFLALGELKYNITCAMCHGVDGQGQGPIAQRATAVGAKLTGWTDPSNVSDETRRTRSVGHLYNTVNNGIRKMGGYGTQLNVEERWAVVAWVKTLQLANGAPPTVLTEEQRRGLQ